MNHIKQLIHEIHRRSLWQVLGIFVAASWGVLQAVELLTETAGLPDWTPSMALVLLLIGLPMCLATAFVQEGLPGQAAPEPPGGGGADAPPGPGGAASGPERAPPPEAKPAPAPADRNLAAGTGSLDLPSTRPSGTRRLFTWRNAILGGVGAFALLGFTLVAYFTMWSLGVGPVGNLVAQGVITNGERVVLADFEDTTGEGLGTVVTDALRVDLRQASVLALADEADVASTLRRMQVEPGTPVTSTLAAEVAVRDGLGAYIDGSVAPVGSGYLVTATLREAQSGRAMASFRVTANGPDQLIASIDKLSQDLREKSGESLRQIRAGEPLEQVTTSSLDALKLYSEANRYFSDDPERAIELLQRAVAIDPAFAMAWRRMAAAYFNTFVNPVREREAATRAFEHRDRLTERERLQAEAYYYSSVLGDKQRSIQAYEELLRIAPDDPSGLNNLANRYAELGQIERAVELFQRAVDGPGRTVTAYSNLITYQLVLGRLEAAAVTLAGWEVAYPDSRDIPEHRFLISLLAGALDRAEQIARDRRDDGTLPAEERSIAAEWLARVSVRRGRIGEARQRYEESRRIAATVGPERALLPWMSGAYMDALVGDGARTARELRSMLADRSISGFAVDANLPAFWMGIAGSIGDTVLVRDVEAWWARERSGPLDDAVTHDVAMAWALARARSGRTGGAIDAFEAALQAKGCVTDYCARVQRAMVHAAAGDPVRAISLYESLAASASDFTPFVGLEETHALLGLGPLYEQVGDTAAAVAAYRRVETIWSDADAEGRAVVQRVRERIAALDR